MDKILWRRRFMVLTNVARETSPSTVMEERLEGGESPTSPTFNFTLSNVWDIQYSTVPPNYSPNDLNSRAAIPLRLWQSNSKFLRSRR